MRASTKRILSILLSGVFLIGLIVVATTLIKPEFETATQKRALLYSKQNLLGSQQNAVSQVQELINTFQGFNELQNTISLAMPTKENSTLILNQLTAIARNSNVEILGFESFANAFEDSDEPVARRLGSMQIEITVAGDYDEVKNFVELLETNVRIFNVRELAMSPTFREGVGNVIEGSIIFTAYFQE